ncbi:hypothetical protein EDD11_006023 [Mortierella claussenii]|nr:hypothetical protein EDD11_006023 [Mortierella claussenii]
MTAPVHSSTSSSAFSYNHFNSNSSSVMNRSRSSSRSTGGVVFTTRPRAASEAARSAMEAMILRRLDQVAQRLNEFNVQSSDIRKRTRELAEAFQDKADRLYLVEDHLLKIQGKSGLFEDGNEDEGEKEEEEHDAHQQPSTAMTVKKRRSRRLTNDLEELRMGVKTLRKKFQVAGQVASTVALWKNLKQASDQTGEAVRVEATLASNEKEGGSHALQQLFISPYLSYPTYHDLVYAPKDSSEKQKSTNEVQHQPTGLCSPPLTPKAPLSLSGSSSLTSLSSYSAQKSHAPKVKSRPLSIIPDLEEPIQLPSSSSLSDTTSMMVQMSPDDPDTDCDKNVSSSSSFNADLCSAEQHASDFARSDEPRQVLLSPPVLPLTLTDVPNNSTSQVSTSGVKIMHSEHHAQAELTPTTTGAFALREPSTRGTDLEKHGEEALNPEHDALVEVEKEDKAVSRRITLQSDNQHQVAADTNPAEIGNDTPIKHDITASITTGDREQEQQEQPLLLLHAETSSASILGYNVQQGINNDNWIQILWRQLIRAECFLFSTAVLGGNDGAR